MGIERNQLLQNLNAEFDKVSTFGLERKSAVLNGKEVRYLESRGAYSTHNPLVMIPGWPVSADTLKPLMQELGGEFKCYAVNLPGFGGSETNYRTNHTFAYYADFLEQFRERVVGSDKIDLFGYSTGGVLGIMYDSKFQETLDKLVLFAPPYNGIEHYEITREKNFRLLPLFDLLKEHRTLTFPLNRRFVKDRIVETMINDAYLKRYPELLYADDDFTSELREESSKFDFKAVIDMGADLSDNDFSRIAREVRTPTLVIAAENDEAVSPERARKLSKLIQGSQYALIPDADHAVGIAEPQRMARLVGEFLQLQD